MNIIQLSVQELAPRLNTLKELLDSAYQNSHMLDDLKEDLRSDLPFFAALVAYEGTSPAGFITVQEKAHGHVPYAELPPLHIQRFTVSPGARGRGFGAQLLARARDTAKTGGYSALFGQSNESGALRLYGKQGAHFCEPSIRSISNRNTNQSNLAIFRLMMTERSLQEWRYPVGNGIPFVFCLDESVRTQLAEAGYAEASKIVGER